MSITAPMVKELRERTGAGMMECKRALVEASGDLDAAAEALRAAGAAKADKKASRVAADGRVVIQVNGSKAVIVEVNSETDFVAKDENFIGFADAVAAASLASGVTDAAALTSVALGDATVEVARTELVQKVGENISVRRAEIIANDGPIGVYTHGARIGAVVALDGGDEILARDIAMHVAATNPTCIDESGVPAEMLETEKRIFTEQAGRGSRGRGSGWCRRGSRGQGQWLVSQRLKGQGQWLVSQRVKGQGQWLVSQRLKGQGQWLVSQRLKGQGQWLVSQRVKGQGAVAGVAEAQGAGAVAGVAEAQGAGAVAGVP